MGIKGHLEAGISVLIQTSTGLKLPKHTKMAYIEAVINNSLLSYNGRYSPMIHIQILSSMVMIVQ